MRSARLLGLVLLGVLIGVAGIYGIEKLVSSRDKSQVAAQQEPGQAIADQGRRQLRPGERAHVRFKSDPPVSGPHVAAAVTRNGASLSNDQLLQALEEGNVVVFYSSPRPPAALRSLADELAGPFDADLAASGQAVILARRPGVQGVLAAAWRHLQSAKSPSDPMLRNFVSYWLGRGAS